MPHPLRVPRDPSNTMQRGVHNDFSFQTVHHGIKYFNLSFNINVSITANLSSSLQFNFLIYTFSTLHSPSATIYHLVLLQTATWLLFNTMIIIQDYAMFYQILLSLPEDKNKLISIDVIFWIYIPYLKFLMQPA